MQETFLRDQAVAFDGMLADTMFGDTISKPALLACEFGRVVVAGTDDNKTVRKPFATETTVSLSTALIASNSTIVTVNGVATAPTVYSGSSGDTLSTIAGLVAALDGVASCTVATTGVGLIITADDNTELTVSANITLGVSQPTVTIINGIKEPIFGISQHQQKSRNSDGTSLFAVGETVPVAKKRRIHIRCEDAFTTRDSVFVRIVEESGAAQKLGMLKTSVGASYVAVATDKIKFLNKGSAGALAKVEITISE